MNVGTSPNGTNILFNGVYANPENPLWAFNSMTSPANLEVSTLTVNSYPAGNILLTHNVSSAVEYNAPLLFQRPPTDINAPVEALVMNTSVAVPTKPVDGEYITALKTNGTVYDDIAVAGLQVFGNQTVGSPAAAYINGLPNGDLNLSAKGSVNISSLNVSTLTVGTVVSTTTNTATSYTATQFMSTPVIYTDLVAAKTANISTINVSTLNAPSFAISTINSSTVNSIFSDTKVSLISTLSLTGSPTNINLGLGDVIQGLVGGAATQAIGAGLGGAGLITGATALISGRTSGGVNSNVFQTINSATQLQFSTIGSAVSSIFLTVNSPNPLTTPGLETRVEEGVAAGTYCVRSVGDPLYITNNVSSIQMYGQWVPVIQPTATIPAVAISSLGVSSINNAPYPPPGGGGGIPSTLAASTITVNGALTQSGSGTFNWGGNTMSPTQVVLARPTSVNNTLTTTGAAFLNAGATVNSGLTVASGGANFTGNVTVNNSLFAFQILQGQTIQATGSLSVGGGGVSIVGGGINMAAGNLTMTNGSSVANITNVVVGQSMRANAISTNQISTNNINVNTINNAPYPPGGGGSASTLNASTINFNGGLNNIGSAPITTNNINLVNINGSPYSPGGGAIPSTLNASTINVNGGLTVNNGNVNVSTSLGFNNSGFIGGSTDLRFRLGGAANRFQFVQNSGNNDAIIMDLNSDKTTRLYSTLLVRDSTWPFPQPSQAAIRTYDTGEGPFGSILTRNVSTVNANFNNSAFLESGTDFRFRLGGSTNRMQFVQNSGNNDAIIMDLNSNKTTRFYSTLLVRDSTWPSPQPSGAAIRTYDTSDPVPYGSVITSNVSSLTANINSIVVTSNALLGSISTNAISTSGILASNGNIAQLAVSSINGNVYPPPIPPLVPVGSITIWAGGSDNGSVQNFNVPSGWLLCDGAEYDRTVYSNLFGVIGTKYGLNKPNTGLNFYVPDLTFAVPMGTPYRNYTSTIFSPSPFQVYAQSWQSDFAPPATPSSKTWKINQTVGGTLNYGTMFPASGFTISGFPTLYVSQILSYDGYQGYIVVKSVNGAAIPDIPGGNQIIVQADGTVAQDANGTYLYTLGSYGVNSGYPQVTHNQTAAEVGNHTHQYSQTTTSASVQNFTGTTIFSVNAAANVQTGFNQLSTISSFGATNIATYTAPNFLNMLYIIKF
jgi:microcystin-dependent protein